MKIPATIALLFTSVFALTPFALSQSEKPGIEGDWYGALHAGAVDLRLVLHISHAKDGSLTGTLDSLDQGASGIPLDKVTFSDHRLQLVLSRVNGGYDGTANDSLSEIKGTWTQGTSSLPLDLTRAPLATPKPLNRPQIPKKPYPYKEEQLKFDGGAPGVKLAGTLTEPSEGGPFPAVLLVSGSGPQNRNEEVFAHPVFLVLSDYLTRQGFAVLRYDKRGCAESTGNYKTATTKDFADDALAAIAYLKSRRDVKPDALGAIGHSEGGVIVPLLATRSSDVKFIVLMAGTGVDGGRIIELQSHLISLANGESEQKIAAQDAFLKGLIADARNDKSDEAFHADVDKLISEAKKKLTPAEVKAGAGKALDGQAAAFESPWMKYFVTYDPGPTLTKVSCPVLAINGQRDLQVPADANLPVIRASLKAGGNKDYEVKELPGLNHLFQPCKTGSPSEYGKIDLTISPDVLKLIGDWLQAHAK